jgi:hypothetical protein
VSLAEGQEPSAGSWSLAVHNAARDCRDCGCSGEVVGSGQGLRSRFAGYYGGRKCIRVELIAKPRLIRPHIGGL